MAGRHNPESDVSGDMAYKSMLMVYYMSKESIFVFGGKEGKWLFPDSRDDNYFLGPDDKGKLPSRDEAHAEFKRRKEAFLPSLSPDEQNVHVPIPRINSRGIWECRYCITTPDHKFGFPKGSAKYMDQNDAKATALREFREETGVQIPRLFIENQVPHRIGNLFVFLLDTTEIPGLKSILDSVPADMQISELFSIGWIHIRKRANLNASSNRAVALLPNPKVQETKEFRKRMYDQLRAMGYTDEEANAELRGGSKEVGRNKSGTRKRRTGDRVKKTRRAP
jgi:8-oxo-dGTP pyrophosphatase MutT (NUDIX family)